MTQPVNLPALNRAMLDTYQHELNREIDEPGRLEAVYGSGFLSASRNARLDAICQTAAQITSSPAAEINILTATEQITIAKFGDHTHSTPISESYCQHQLIPENRPMRITDSLDSALLCSVDATTEGGIRAYLGVPLITVQKWMLGTLCVFDFKPRRWHASDVTLLTTLAAQIMVLAQIEAP